VPLLDDLFSETSKAGSATLSVSIEGLSPEERRDRVAAIQSLAEDLLRERRPGSLPELEQRMKRADASYRKHWSDLIERSKARPNKAPVLVLGVAAERHHAKALLLELLTVLREVRDRVA
jgi:hypothetical protein